MLKLFRCSYEHRPLNPRLLAATVHLHADDALEMHQQHDARWLESGYRAGYSVNMEAVTSKAIDRRLARVEGQVKGLRRMVEENKYCIDILTQLSAVRSALDQIGAELAASHVKSCILGHGSAHEQEHCQPMSQDELVEELKMTLSRLMR